MAKRSRLVLSLILLAAIAAAGLWIFAKKRPTEVATGVRGTTGGELVGSLRSEPAGYNRYIEPTAAADVLALLTHSTLVSVDRATDELQPGLAESWTQSADGLNYTLKLRNDVQFSDGAPFTSADVLFTARVVYDEKTNSSFGSSILVAGKPLTFEAPDPFTVVVRLPAPFVPGLRLLAGVPILPKHKLEAALDSGTFGDQWKAGTPLTSIAGLGPFVLDEHIAGQRMVFARNNRYWRRDTNGVRLPYLDKLTIAIIPDQNTEALRIQSGEIDLMAVGDIRAEDHAAFRRAGEQGKLRLIDVGVGLDPNFLWFNLRGGNALFKQRAFRQAISYAVDRQAIVNTVFLGAGVPIYGPVTPGNKTWYSESAPAYPHDPVRARELLKSIGLQLRAADGLLTDAKGRPVRFSLLAQKGHTVRERTAAMIQEHLRQVGITVDIVGLDPKEHLRAMGVGRLRDCLPRHPGELDGSVHRNGGFLVQQRFVPPVEPRPEITRHRVGDAHRRSDAQSGHRTNAIGEAAALCAGAEDLRRRAAGNLSCCAARHPRRQQPGREPAAGTAGAATALER